MHIKNFDPYDFSKKEIDGVTVYYKNLPWAPCIHIQWAFSTGAFADPVGQEGVAHFLEHMIGNGCPSLPDKKAIRDFSRLYMLNSRNAFTGHDITAYVGRCLPEHFPLVISKMKEYVFHPILRAEDVEHERKVITQEAWGRYKNTKFLAYVKELSKNIYHGHERARISSPLGWPETVATITQENISDFHKKNYVKENLSIFLAGAIEEKDMDQLTEIIKTIPNGNKTEKISGAIHKPLEMRFVKTGEEIGDPREQLEFTLTRPLNELPTEKLAIANQTRMLLYDALFERLRTEHSLCYGVSVWIDKYKGYGEAGISVNTSVEKLSLVEQEIRNIIEEIVQGKWKDRFNTIHILSVDQIRSNERSTETVLGGASNAVTTTNQITPLQEILKKEEIVTYKDVQDLVKDLFDPEYVFTEIILPSKK